MLASWPEVIDAIGEAIVTIDATSTIVYANRAGADLLGWTTDELVGAPLTRIIPERFRQRHAEGLACFLETGRGVVVDRPVVLPALRADGTETSVELVVTPVNRGGERFFVGLLRSVADRIELEGPGELADLLAATFATVDDLDAALDRVATAAGKELGWDLVQVWLLEDSGTDLRRVAWWARDAAALQAFLEASKRLIAVGAGLPGRVVESGAPQWVDDVAGATWWPRHASAVESGLATAFAFPLRAGDRVIGAMELLASTERGPSPALMTRLVGVGGELGWFIERRRLEAARRRLQGRLSFLADASAELSASLHVEETLERIATLAVPTLGDWCTVFLVEDGAISLRAAVHRDPERVALLRDAQRRYPTSIDASGGVGAVIRTGEMAVDRDVDDGVLNRIARDETHLDLLRRFGFGSVVTVPLTAAGRTIGALTVATETPGGLDDETIQTATDLARRASAALENARLHDEALLHASLLEIQADAGLEGQLVVSPTGRMLSFNRRFVELWRIPEDVIDGRVDDDALEWALTQVADPDAFLARIRELYRDPRPARDEIRMLDGRVLDRFGAPLVLRNDVVGYAWYFRDVTEQRQAADELAALARTLQQSLLPPQLPPVPGADVAARYLPGGRGLEVGGDFYDVFRLGAATWGVVIGDVCGKGADAAAVTALVRYTVRAAAMQKRSPAGALVVCNDAMRRHIADGGVDLFATAVLARLRQRDDALRVTIAVAGHPAPLVRRAGGGVERVGATGTLLGVFDRAKVGEVTVELGAGDALVLVTDGVLEARRAGEQFGDERLAEVLAGTVGATSEATADAIVEAVLGHRGDGDLVDDVAVLVVTGT